MTCTNCKNDAIITISSNPFCKKCFKTICGKRIRKFIRSTAYVNKNDKVLIVGELTEKVFKEIIKGLPLKIETIGDKEFHSDTLKFIKRLEKQQDKYDKIIIPWTAEHECCLFLEQMTSKKPNFSYLGKTINNKFIKLFRILTEEEAIQLAKQNNLTFIERKQDTFTEILDKMQSKYPEARFSLLKSIDNLEEVLNDDKK
jgi:hypothetical protein